MTNTQTTPEVTTNTMYTSGYHDSYTNELIVTRDGDIDYEYHEQHDHEQRRAYLKAYVGNIGKNVLHAAVEALHDLGDWADAVSSDRVLQ